MNDAITPPVDADQFIAQNPNAISSSDAPPPGMEDFVRDELNELTYGTFGQQAISALEGAARGVSLGLYDVAAPAFGASREAIQARREINPVTSFMGEAAGGAGLLALTGGLGAAGEAAVLAPETINAANAAARTAQAAGLSLPEIEAARKAAIYANTTLSQRIATSAATAGMEGAIFGAGSAISDYGLGDPNLTAEKIAADIGVGALVGAGLGAVGQGIDEIFNKSGKVKGTVSEKIDQANAKSAKETVPDQISALDDAIINENPSQVYLRDRKPLSKETLEAAVNLDLPVLETVLSDDPLVARAVNTLLKDAPTAISEVENAKYQDAWNKMMSKFYQVNPDYGLTPVQAGVTMKNGIIEKLKTVADDFDKLFSEADDVFSIVNVNPRSATAIAREIRKLPEVAQTPGSKEAQLALRVASDILNAQTVDDIAYHLKTLSRSRQSIDPGERYMAEVLAEKLQNWKYRTVENYAKRIEKSIAGLPHAINFAENIRMLKSAVKTDKIARQKYAEWRPQLNELASAIGIRKVGGINDAIGEIEKLPVETLMNNLLYSKDIAGRERFISLFPEQYELLKQYQKSNLHTKSQTKGFYNIGKFFDEFNKLKTQSPEMLETVFTPSEIIDLTRLNAYRTGAFPKDWNPSGTAFQMSWKDFFMNPKGFLVAHKYHLDLLRDIQKRINMPEHLRSSPEKIGADIALRYNSIQGALKIIDNTEKTIKSGVLGLKGVAVPGIVPVVTDNLSYDQKISRLEELAANPEMMSAQVDLHIGDHHETLPNVTTSFAADAVRSVQFLNSKIPRPNNLQQIDEWKPSDAQKQKFMRYYEALNNPTQVLKQVKDGSLTQESVEALQQGKPALYEYMKRQVEQNVNKDDIRKMNEKQKRALSLFLGRPVATNQLQPVRAANQMFYAQLNNAQNAQNQALMGKPTLGGMAKLDVAGRAQTGTDRPPVKREV